MIDFLFRATTRKDFEAMARTAQFIDAENKPLPGIDVDPTIGTPEYETGIPIIDTPPRRKVNTGCPQERLALQCRVSGEREQEEIEGLPQTDGKAIRCRRVSARISASPSPITELSWSDGATEGISYQNVALLNELTIVSPQRVWQ